MSHHYVAFEEVYYAYPDGTMAVNGITLRIHHGESVALLGRNGAGKSTFTNLMTGILLPDQGRIVIGDIPINKKNLSLIRQRLGFVFQDADAQLFMPTVYEDVAFGPRNYNLDEKDVEQKVIKALDTVGALHLKDRAPYKLSGGEKRAVAIATVLSMEPDILVMDEPSSGLDPAARRKLIALLKDFSHTKIIATHDMDLALNVCNRTIVLYDGKIVADGPSAEILEESRLLTWGL